MTQTTTWQRYRPMADVVLEFDASVAAIGRDGRSRVTRTQHLREGERFAYLPAMKEVPHAD